jgi:hypothetical protein
MVAVEQVVKVVAVVPLELRVLQIQVVAVVVFMVVVIHQAQVVQESLLLDTQRHKGINKWQKIIFS